VLERPIEVRTSPAALALLLTTLVGCSDDGTASPEAAVRGSGSWRAGAPSPVGPRWSPVAVWTGTEALVLGGGTDSPCPPNASCTAADPMASDGAAYDPATDSWREIADAPVPIGYWFRPVVVGGTVVLFDGDRRWLGYSIESDSWASLPAAPAPVADSGQIPALDGRVYVVAESGRVLVLDVASKEWSQLPLDEQEPRLKPYAVMPTDDGVFACGADPDAPDDGDTPAFTIVDRWDGQAWSARFPTTGTVGNVCEHWTGSHLVSRNPQTATGLNGDPSFGGRLDPETGEWSPLPDVPSETGRGYMYDDESEGWVFVGEPSSKVDGQQGSVRAGRSLLVFGGIDEQTAYDDPSGISAETWIWTP
jgi:hypothetical protein